MRDEGPDDRAAVAALIDAAFAGRPNASGTEAALAIHPAFAAA